MRVTVIGSGYVALVTSAGLAEFGNDVICVADAEVGFYEPGLPELIDSNVSAGRMSFNSDLAAAVKDAEVIIYAARVPATRVAHSSTPRASVAPPRDIAEPDFERSV